MTRGVPNWYRFIVLYYRLNVMFTAFVIDERYRLDGLKLLQGGVCDEEESAVLSRMRAIVKEVCTCGSLASETSAPTTWR